MLCVCVYVYLIVLLHLLLISGTFSGLHIILYIPVWLFERCRYLGVSLSDRYLLLYGHQHFSTFVTTDN